MIPIMLQSMIQTSAYQSLGSPNETYLKNPLDGPMLIDEIRLRSPDAPAYPFGSLRLSLKVGTHQVAYRVHAWLFARRRDPNVSDPRPFHTLVDSTVTPDQRLMSWRFKTPIWLERGQLLEPTIEHSAESTTDTIETSISYIGRAANESDRPRVRKLPWACSFVGTKRTNMNADFAMETSKRTDLCNPFDTPLSVIRLTGRVYTTVSATNYAAAIDRYTTLRIVDSGKRIVVRDQTPFAHLLDHTDRVWNVKAQLPPFGYYTAFLTESFAAINEASVDFVPYIGLIGERSVATFDRV